MRAWTVFLIKALLSAIFVVSLCVLFTAIIIGVVVVQQPENPMSYVALSFILLVDGIVLFCFIAPFRKVKYKPKTISKHLVFWLSMVLYLGAAGATMLLSAFFSTSSTQFKTIAMVFCCIFGGLGLAALGVLIYEVIGYIQIKQCLKYGEETTAEYVEAGKSFNVHYGKERHGTTIACASVIFKFTDYDGREREAKSKCVFTWDEMDTLEKMGTFKIKYDYRTAVILETFEPEEKEEEKETPEPKEEEQDTVSENKGEE